LHELGDVAVIERLVVSTGELLGLGQEKFEVALPARRVGSIPIDVAKRPRRVDDLFDTAPESI
jgi:hypothetical protein